MLSSYIRKKWIGLFDLLDKYFARQKLQIRTIAFRITLTQITNDYLELYQTMQIEFDLSENNKNLICILFCLTLFHCIWLYLWCMRQLNYEINTHWFDMEFEMNNKIQMHDINCLPLHSAVWEMSVKRLEGRDKTETIVNIPQYWATAEFMSIDMVLIYLQICSI